LTMPTSNRPSAQVIQLHGMLVRSQVSTQLEFWKKAFQAFLVQAQDSGPQQAEIVVSLKGIEKVDTAGLAVLLQLSRQASQQGVDIVFQEPSLQLRALAQLCSLNKLLRFS
jgi:anti-anti-sigma factor